MKNVDSVKNAVVTRFLQHTLGLGDWRDHIQLIAIADSGKISARIFQDADAAITWATEHNERQEGIYYSFAGVPAELKAKAGKADLTWLYGLHLDADPPKENMTAGALAEWRETLITRLIDGALKNVAGVPDIVVSGNGLQALWPFEKLVRATPETIARIEDLNRRVAAALGLSKVSEWNADRVLRLPGTVNWPNEKKRKLGRVPVLATLEHATVDAFAPEDFDGLPELTGHKAAREANQTAVPKQYTKDYAPVTWGEARDCHAPFADWNGSENPEHEADDPSDQFWDLAQKALSAILEARACTLAELDEGDVAKNVLDLVTAFVGTVDSESTAFVAEHLDRRGGYTVGRLISGSALDRGPAEAASAAAFQRLTSSLSDEGETEGPDWATDTHEAVKAACRDLAASGLEDADPIAFDAQLEAITLKAKQHNLDIGKKRGGRKLTLLDEAYRAEKKALENEARKGKAEDPGKALTKRGAEKISGFVFLPTRDRYIHMPSGRLWTEGAVNAATFAPEDDEPAEYLRRARRVDGVVWLPGDPLIIEGYTLVDNYPLPRKGSALFNAHRPGVTRRGDPDKAWPWLDHLDLLYPNEADEILDVFAFFVQNSGIKINQALLLLGPPGIGKDWLLQPLIYAVGEHNVKTIGPIDIMKDFDEFKRSELLIINELTDLGHHTKFAFHDKSKELMAAPPNYFIVNPKYGEKTVVKNVCLPIGMSNHYERATYLPSNDRRHFVAHSEIERDHFGKDATEQGAFWADQYRWMQADGKRHVLAFLEDQDVSHFNPGTPPRRTQAWHDIVEFNYSNERAEAEDHQAANGEWPNAIDVRWIVENHDMPQTLRLFFSDGANRRRVGEKMREFGYTKQNNDSDKRGRWKIQGQNLTIFVHENLHKNERKRAAEKWCEKRNK